MTRVTGTSPEDQHTYLIMSRSFLLRMINVSGKIIEKIKTNILCPITFFLENRAVYEKMWKNPAEPGMPSERSTPKSVNTPRIRNNY
jgi:hypothetical protein